MKQWGSLIVLGLCIACLVIVGVLSPSPDSFAQNTLQSSAINGTAEANLDLVESLEVIKQKMAKARFCYNESCTYRNITSKIMPPATAHEPYTATISAAISRPSASPDLADYHFAYEPVGRAVNNGQTHALNEPTAQHWHLIKGEEFTDVADFVFIGDHYEIYGVHSNRVQRGTLNPDPSESNIKAGYASLYYQVLDQGWQK
jgi:hypothetical protein